MNKINFNGVWALLLSGIIGLASLAHAEVAYSEQIVPSNGRKSVSIDGQWAAVGAYDENDENSCYVTMYKLDYTTMEWGYHSTLGGKCMGKNKGFGAAISLSGSGLVVGLKDYGAGSSQNVGAFSAYAYDSIKDSWKPLIERVMADDPQAFSGFGTAVKIQEGILLIGAPQHDGVAGTDTGKVYLYERPADFKKGLPETVTIEGDQSGSLFGSAVSGDNKKILVGASAYDQGGLTDNGAGFMYAYNASVPSLTMTGELYGSVDDERLGLRFEYTGTLAVIAGDLRSYRYRFNGSDWQLDLTLESTLGGDVDTIDNAGTIATKGTSVNIYPLLDRPLNNYFLEIVPTGGTPGTEFAEDISLSQNHLAVSEFDKRQTRFYTMPCGYGGSLVKYKWSMVSIPCKVTGQTVESIFGDDGLGTYGTNWVVWEQNTNNYSGKSADAIKLDTNSTIVQGKSYWIIADTDSTWKVDSSASSAQTDLDTTIVAGPDVIAGTHAIALPTADQNVSGDMYAKVMLGNPFPRSFEWTNVQYYSAADGNISSLSSAETLGYMESTAYIYDSASTSGQPYAAITSTPGVGSKTTIPANRGFYIKILKGAAAGDKLLIPLEK